ncbi:hypothetical protein [Thermotomaculum hydrothermale]|nr:hypothetical protein [Thermotomaculum hydrothermale]
MRKLLIIILAVAFTFAGFAKTRHLGDFSYINTDGPINVAVNAVVAVKFNKKKYLPFILYLGTDKGVTANIDRNSIVMEYKGRIYHLPSYKEWRKNYNEDVYDLSLFSREPEHVFPSEMSIYQFQTDVDFFPARNEGLKIGNLLSISYRIGAVTKVYFKNPGIKRGDTIKIKIFDKDNKSIYGEVEIKF